KMMHSPLLAPVVALVLWSFVMCAWLYATRIPAIRKRQMVYDPQRPAAEFHAQLPAEVRWKADNYNNLMEQPNPLLRRGADPRVARSGHGFECRSRLALCRLAGGSQRRSGDDQHGHASLRHFHGCDSRSAGDVPPCGPDCVLRFQTVTLPNRRARVTRPN